MTVYDIRMNIEADSLDLGKLKNVLISSSRLVFMCCVKNSSI